MTAFNDPEVARLLTDKFVPIATDYRDWYRQDADGEFFRKVTKLIPYRQSGACAFTVDGEALAAGYATSKGEVLQLIQSALRKFQPPGRPDEIEPLGEVDVKNYKPIKAPEGTVICNSIMTHLTEKGAGYYPGNFGKLLSQVVGMDRLWIRKDEADALANGRFPETLKRRIARWHLIDNNFFGRNQDSAVKQFDVELLSGRVCGSIRIESGSSVMRLDLLGFVEAKDGKLSRFDLVARGTRQYAPGAKGGYAQELSTKPYPLAYAFTLTDEQHFTFRIPPHTVLAHSENVYFRD